MANKYLSRGDAPFGAETWETLDRTVVEAAKSVLAGRRLLHIDGPYGLGLKAVSTADPEVESGPIVGSTIPLVLVHKGVTIAKRDLAAHERDGVPLDTGALAEAAIECAQIEDCIVFQGSGDAPGLLTVEGRTGLALSSWDEVGTAAEDLIRAVTALDGAGFHGPYCVALAPARYNLLLRRYPRGNYSEMEHARTIATAGVVKAPVLESGGVFLASGRRFASIVLGQDMSLGFIGPAAERLEFSISESLALVIRQPGAVCALLEG
ncbi:MAG: bacteriocin family protein [Gemmatimonadetes bacterium]|nr:bacteriocin family protein [Gemmatimonadota bacterium]